MDLRRLARLYVGLILFGVSTALMVRSRLGLMSWSVFHEGLSLQTGLSMGLIVNLVGVVVLLAWIPLRQRPGLGTISNVVVIGVALDAALAVVPKVDPLAWRIALMALGIVLNGYATAAYISAGYGAGPRDGVTLGLAKITGLSIKRARMCVELGVLACGWLLGGAVGVGTILHALTIGPMMQAWMQLFARLDARTSAARSQAALEAKRA
ncbi:YitT family protein [Caulobacter sp. 17J80-11]|uniref:membrane protein YczE n=1 Tax=Caulobacter sp. 17J80-11 TaxID=2763502 RepID=UPI0016539F72|nr:hypothetical protein [Caulobacter sp. 17J80-11]MBC6981824.1 hypothetical protein [Caulobacter sp. 17J80-11]